MWWLLMVTSCAHRAPDAAAVLAAQIAEADRAWAARGELGLEAVGAPLLDAWRLAPEDPEVGWRLVRWRVAQGSEADGEGALTAFGQAREQGAACLDADPTFAAALRRGGWEQALPLLREERRTCAAWLSLAWVRWLEAIGPEAASLDLETLDRLAATPTDDDVGPYAAGLLLGVRPSWAGRDPELARLALRAATERDPTSLVRWVDLWRWGVLPVDQAQADQLRARILAMPADVPEDRSARAAMLEASPQGD